MKICILLDISIGGGVGRFALEEVKWLRRLGYEAELVVLMKPKHQNNSLSSKQTKYLSDAFPFLFKTGFRLPFFHFFSSFHVLSPLFAPFILVNNYDIIVSHATYTCFTAIQLWRIRKIPYIAYIHDPISYIISKVYSKGALSHFFPVMLLAGHYLDRLIVSEARKCLTQSMFHLKFLKNIVKGKIEVLYPGCYPENEIMSNRGEYILTMKSMWDANKNAGFLLKLLSEVKHDARLIMVGGWERNFYESFVKKVKGRGLEDRVEIKGYVNEDELRRLYRNARLLIHPSVEAFGMSGLEAASYGCPFIMPEGSGVTDIFSHGVHGFFPREGDLYNYIKFTDKLLSDERFAWKMGKTAWVKAKQYTWKRHSMQLARIIDSTLQ